MFNVWVEGIGGEEEVDAAATGIRNHVGLPNPREVEDTDADIVIIGQGVLHDILVAVFTEFFRCNLHDQTPPAYLLSLAIVAYSLGYPLQFGQF